MYSAVLLTDLETGHKVQYGSLDYITFARLVQDKIDAGHRLRNIQVDARGVLLFRLSMGSLAIEIEAFPL